MKLKLKQSHLAGAWWGNIQLTSQHANTFIQVFILAFSGTAAYGVIADALHQWGYTLPFWQFVLAVVVCLMILLSFVWTIGMPSIFISWNRQWWNHRNPYRADYEKFKKQVLKDLDDIKAALDEKH